MDLIPKEVWTNKMHEYNVNHYMDLYAEGGRKNVIRWKCLSTLYKDLDFNPPLVAFFNITPCTETNVAIELQRHL